MQSSQPRGDPRILQCPHCGAPLDAQAFSTVVRCAYCGRSVHIGTPSGAQQASPLAPAPSATGTFRRLAVLFGVVAVAVIGLAVALFAGGGAGSPPALVAAPEAQISRPLAPAVERRAAQTAAPSPASQPAAKSRGDARSPLRSLLGIDVTADIDRSSEHVLGLFPSAGSSRAGDGLRYELALEHPWFEEVRLTWKNEKAGKLTSVSFSPPQGDAKFKNQKEIADCLGQGLGKPQVRELDHLAGELSYFWGKHFPKAWANLYPSYLWLTFENPKGIAPVTLSQVVRTLDACTPAKP